MASCDTAPAPTPGQEAPRTTSPLPSASAADIAGPQAIRAYMGMWAAMARAGETSDWRSSELAQYAAGNALTTITRSLYTDRFNHVVTRGWPKNNPTVVSVETQTAPATVMLSDCGDSTKWLKYWEGTNKPVDEKPGGRQSIVAEVKKQADGSWRVSQFAVHGVNTC